MPNQPSDKITRVEMKGALLRSGYLLESRVETQVRNHWSYTEANSTYPDLETGKSREFDLYAMTALPAGPGDHDFLWGVLLIECINNPQPFVILTKEPLNSSLHHEEVKMAGLPVKIPAKDGGNGWRRLSEFLGMNEYHHYCKGRVGTQFCSFAKKKSGRDEEWMAMHEGSHFDSFKKLCDVTDHFIEKHFTSWVIGTNENLNVEVYYPLIILQGDLIEARETRRSVNFRAADHLQFRRSVAIQGRDINYQIDVIRERYLPKYLAMINKELWKTAELLSDRREIVQAAIVSIVEDAKDADSAQEMRRIMEYDD
jgi:hypothetical protein